MSRAETTVAFTSGGVRPKETAQLQSLDIVAGRSVEKSVGVIAEIENK